MSEAERKLFLFEGESAMVRFLDPQPFKPQYFMRTIGDTHVALCPMHNEQYESKMRALVNAFEIIQVREAIPVRKKKSWMRYTSQKKWANRFSKRFIKEFSATPKVLSITDDVLKRITALSAAQTDLKKLTQLKRLQKVMHNIPE